MGNIFSRLGELKEGETLDVLKNKKNKEKPSGGGGGIDFSSLFSLGPELGTAVKLENGTIVEGWYRQNNALGKLVNNGAMSNITRAMVDGEEVPASKLGDTSYPTMEEMEAAVESGDLDPRIFEKYVDRRLSKR